MLQDKPSRKVREASRDRAPILRRRLLACTELHEPRKGLLGPYTCWRNVVSIAMCVLPNVWREEGGSEFDHGAKGVDGLLGRVDVELELVHQVEKFGEAQDKPDERIGMLLGDRFADGGHVWA